MAINNRTWSNVMRMRTIPKGGFTLVEMVVYIALFSMLSLVAVTSTITIMKSFYSMRLTQNIVQSGTTALERMALEVRNAYDIDLATSTLNSSPGRLTLKTKDSGGNNTTVEFYVNSYANPSPVWTQFGFTQTYRAIAMSADGIYQTAAGPGPGYLYVSSDRGVTWTQKGTAQNYYGLDMSPDGKYQAAATAGYIYTSSNYGVSWTQRGAYHQHYGIAISSDGKYVTAAANGGYLLVSSDFGVTWTLRGTGTIAYDGVDMSDDGKYQSVVCISGYVYRSDDYGTTWTQTTLSSESRRAIALSSDGRYQTTASSPGYINISSDYGVTWTQINLVGNYWGVAMSSDGMYQTVARSTGGVYLSSDYGATWTSIGGTQSYTNIAMSSDGGYIAAVSNYVNQYVSKLYQVGMKVGGVDKGLLVTKTVNVPNIVFRLISNSNSKAIKIEMILQDSRQELQKTLKFYDTVVMRGSIH